MVPDKMKRGSRTRNRYHDNQNNSDGLECVRGMADVSPSNLAFVFQDNSLLNESKSPHSQSMTKY